MRAHTNTHSHTPAHSHTRCVTHYTPREPVMFLIINRPAARPFRNSTRINNNFRKPVSHPWSLGNTVTRETVKPYFIAECLCRGKNIN